VAELIEAIKESSEIVTSVLGPQASGAVKSFTADFIEDYSSEIEDP